MRIRQREGQVIALFAFSLVPILLIMAVVLDGGYALAQRRQAQNAADFAALAGARIVLQSAQGSSRTDGNVASAMQTVATANGSTIPGLGTSSGPQYTDSNGSPLSPAVYLGTTSSTASIPSTARGILVGTRTSWRPMFAALIGIASWDASAQATARFQLGGSAPCAICVLGGVATSSNSTSLTVNNGSIYVNGALSTSNSVHVTANNGSIYAKGNLTVGNSSSFSATNGSIVVDGNLIGSNSSTFTASTGTVAVNGNLSLTTSSKVQASAVNVQGTWSALTSSTISPSPPTHTGAVAISITDPLAFLSQPTNPNSLAVAKSYLCKNSATCTFTPTLSDLASVTVQNSSTATISPGIYSLIAVSNSSTVNLQAGTYYIAGSGSISADNSSKIVGLGAVTLVLLDSSSMSVANSAGLQITAPAASLSASTTYPWPGVAIYSARGNTSTLSLANSSSYPITGAVYARDGTLTTANSSTVGVKSLIVVGSYLGANSSSLTTTYDPTQNPRLPGGHLQLVQ